MKTFNVGIIGCGGAAFCIHLPALTSLPDFFKITRVYDVDYERSSFLSNKYKSITACKKPEEIFEDKNIDIVAILSHNHEELINKALDAGKNIFTEKPISLDISYTRSLIEKAKKLDLVLEVGLMRLYDQAIKNFYKNFLMKDLVSGIIYKADGSDQRTRGSLMPKNFKVYNFNKTDAPIVPSNIYEHQLDALKILLWSGIHLLTTLCEYFQNLVVDYCEINKSRSSLVCIFSNELGQQFTLNIIETQVNVYIEEMSLIGKNLIGNIKFSSPYLLGSGTKSSVISTCGTKTKYDNKVDCKSPFIQMWTSIFENITNEKNSKSAEILLRVECLANVAAKKCVVRGK